MDEQTMRCTAEAVTNENNAVSERDDDDDDEDDEDDDDDDARSVGGREAAWRAWRWRRRNR